MGSIQQITKTQAFFLFQRIPILFKKKKPTLTHKKKVNFFFHIFKELDLFFRKKSLSIYLGEFAKDKIYKRRICFYHFKFKNKNQVPTVCGIPQTSTNNFYDLKNFKEILKPKFDSGFFETVLSLNLKHRFVGICKKCFSIIS